MVVRGKIHAKPIPMFSGSIVTSTNFDDTENIGVGYGIFFITVLQPKRSALPV